MNSIKNIENILKNNYDINNFIGLMKEIFENMNLVNPNKFHQEFSNFSAHIKGYTHIGNYNTENKEKIFIASVELQNSTFVENARSTQRNYVKKLIENGNYDSAIVAFYSSNSSRWRLSFVRLEYEMKIENGKLKTTESITPAKRYSYLLGEEEPCHTAIERFKEFIINKNLNPTLNDLEEIFSVEKVTKEFFDLYCEKFYELQEYLDNNIDFQEESKKCGFTSEQFAKKLMGQIVFLYFLQKKGWLGVNVWSKNMTEKEYKNVFFTKAPQLQKDKIQEYLPKIYTKIDDNTYKLNIKMLDEIPNDIEELIARKMPRNKTWGDGSKKFLRTIFEFSKKYKGNFFENYLEPLFYNTLNRRRGKYAYCTFLHCRIPFLSGGLFDPLDGYDWKYNNFNIPDEIFSNKKDENDRNGTGILDIFDRYNFTISEDEPMEKEVAIDPEMLGKIFENLLEIKDRKSKGAFYTPREIVHHMCQESLINYLVQKTSINENAIRDFIIYGDFMKDEDIIKKNDNIKNNNKMFISEELFKIDENEIIVNRLKEIDDALASVKIADPAVGSGAFPLGMINEIVRARQNITAYLTIEMNAFERRYIYKTERSIYNLKLHTIKNCIFGVDIEPSAVDITQLRLWLSLVIDDEVNTKDDSIIEGHFDPLPLPNLECNIICGNSLVDEFEGTKLLNESDIINSNNKDYCNQLDINFNFFNSVVEKLLNAQDKLFICDDPDKKNELKLEIQSYKNLIIEKQLFCSSNELKQSYNEAIKKSSKPFILWQLEFARVFRDNKGFDIVIGNPPYGLLNKKQNRSTSIIVTDNDLKYYKNSDLYSPAKGQVLNIFRLFICKSIDLLKTNGHTSLIFPMGFMCDLSSYNLRKFVLENNKIDYLEVFPEKDDENKRVFKSAKIPVCILGLSKTSVDKNDYFPTRVNSNKYIDFSKTKVFMSRNELELIDASSLTIPIMDLDEYNILLKVCKSSYKMKQFSKCFTGEIDLSLNKKYINLDKKYSKMIRGAQVQKFHITENISQGDILYLNSDLYLSENNSPRSKHHLQKRIVMQGITGVNEKYRLKMSLLNQNIFCANSVNYLLLQEKTYYFLGLLNSNLINWYFSKLSTNNNVNGYEIDNIPVRIAEPTLYTEIENVVLQLIKDYNNLEYISYLNSLIYNLYNLSNDEKNIIEKYYT